MIRPMVYSFPKLVDARANMRVVMANGPENPGDNGAPAVGIATRTKPKTKKPDMFKVLLLNDDYTPMEFVVQVLQDVFHRDRDTAMRIMLHVHQKGVGICGVYSYEVAETKVSKVVDSARQNQHPLQCTMERE
jgi:ATP-dependent Clp protease adaptor protein ClpS